MKKTISVIVISVVLIGALFTSMRVFADRIEKKRVRMDAIRTDIRRMEERQKNIKTLNDIFVEASKKQNAIENIFVNERSIVRVIEMLEKIAGETGVALDVQSATLPAQGASDGPEFQLRIEGTFDGVYRYMRLLEVIPFQITFDIVSINKSENALQGDWSSTIRFMLVSFTKTS